MSSFDLKDRHEISQLARDALRDFSTDTHYIINVVYSDGLELKRYKYFCTCYDGLDELIDSLLSDDMVDLQVVSTHLTLEDFIDLGVKIETPDFY